MEQRWEPGEPGRRIRRRGRREPSPEERAYRAARRRAHRKLGFLTHLAPYCAVCGLLLFVAGFRVAFLVAFFWGIGIACHGFFALGVPELRRRFIDREVRRELHASGPRERRNVEDRHARSLEELAAGVAHEIRNPITAAKSLVQQMGEDPASTENVSYAHVALEELDRVERSISHLLRFARDEELRLEDLKLVDVIESALETFRERVTRQGVVVVRDLDGEGRMRGDSEKLRRVVINLVANALDALDEAGTPEPRLEVAAGENLAGTEVWLRVRDNGPGIPPEALAKLWSPFYTSKQQGTGLGLALSRKVVEAHGGAIDASSEPDAGASFVLSFPKAPAEAR